MLNIKNEAKSNISDYIIVNKSKHFPEINSSDSNVYLDEINMASLISIYKNKIIQEYNLNNGENNLYLDIGDNKLAYLYSHEVFEDGNELYSIFEEDGVYSMTEIAGKMHSLSYTPKKAFEKMTYGFKSKTNLSIENRFNRHRASSYAVRNTDIIVNNYAYIPSSEHKVLADNFRKYFIKYKMSESLFPCKKILDNIESIVNKFIEKKDLDTEQLLNNYMILCAFSEFASSSVQLIAPLIHNPGKVDLNQLSNDLSKKSSNIDYLINLYLEDELKFNTQNQDIERGDR